MDESIKNIQSFNQRLYTNESTISEEITRRIEALKNTEADSYYHMDKYDDLEEYDQEGYEELFADENDESLMNLKSILGVMSNASIYYC